MCTQAHDTSIDRCLSPERSQCVQMPKRNIENVKLIQHSTSYGEPHTPAGLVNAVCLPKGSTLEKNPAIFHLGV